MQAKPIATQPFEPKTATLLEFPRTIPQSFQDVSTNPSRIPEWDSPQSSTQIAEALASICGVELKAFQRNISNWYKVVREAYFWLPETDLRIGNGKTTRYTPFCCQQFEALAQAGKDGYGLWIKSVHDAHPEKLHVEHNPVSVEIPLTPTEVLPSENDRTPNLSVYQRSDALTALLNDRPQIDSTSTPEQNPLVLALQQRVASLTSTTGNVRQQLDQVRRMTSDTRDTIQALEDLAIVERAQAKADRHYQLEQQVYARRLEALGVEDVLGKS